MSGMEGDVSAQPPVGVDEEDHDHLVEGTGGDAAVVIGEGSDGVYDVENNNDEDEVGCGCMQCLSYNKCGWNE